MSNWNVVTLGSVIHFDNRSWRVERYCEEPATGIAVLRECGRGTLTLAIPVGLLADLITSRAELARLRTYIKEHAYCPCCGTVEDPHEDGCDHETTGMQEARAALAGEVEE